MLAIGLKNVAHFMIDYLTSLRFYYDTLIQLSKLQQ